MTIVSLRRSTCTNAIVLILNLALAGLAVAADNSPPKKKFVDNIPPEVTVQSNLEYVSGGGASQSLDLYLPPANGGTLPVVVFVHGGGWRAGTKDDWHPSFHDLLTHGFAVANINYRLSTEAPWPAQIDDCKAAVRWVRAHAGDYHFDPDHIGMWGHSAGGHLTALMGVSNNVASLEGTEGVIGVSSAVQAGCDWSGPVDIALFARQVAPLYSRGVDMTNQLMGGADKATQESLAQASPITYVSASSVPFLIMHGEKDNVVSQEQPKLLDDALKKVGVESTLIIVPGADHGIVSHPSQGPNVPDVYTPVTAFFEKHLKPPSR